MEMIPNQSTLGAAIGYSSGKNSSNLKTPPKQIFQKGEHIMSHKKYKLNDGERNVINGIS